MMAVPPWLRLWLPLGNALLLIAVLETVDMIRSELKEVGIFIYQGLTLHFSDITEFYNNVPELIFFTISITVRLTATIGLLWIGTIINGNKRSLLAWIIINMILAVAIIIFLIITASTAPHGIEASHAWSLAYSFVTFILFNGYVLYITSVSYQALGRQETLHPIGKGVKFIWEYFSNETKTAAVFFLTSEIVLDANYIVSRQFMQFLGIGILGHESNYYPPVIIEEIVLRVIRIITNSLGLWLVSKENRRHFRWWCAFTFLLIMTSTVIFVILTILWRGEDISSTLAYFLMFPGHLLYRFVTLYFCLKFTRADFSSFVL